MSAVLLSFLPIAAMLEVVAAYQIYRIGRAAAFERLAGAAAVALALAGIYQAVTWSQDHWALRQTVADRSESVVALAGAILLVVGLVQIERTLRRVLVQRDRLQKSEIGAKTVSRRLDMLFRLAPDALFVASPGGLVLDANARAETLVGMTAEQMRVLRLPELGTLLDADAPTAAVFMADLAEGRLGAGIEVHGRFHDGRERWMEVCAKPLEMDTQRFVFVSARDITARKQSELEAQRQHESLTLILDQLPAHIWTVDTELRYVSADGRGLQALGVSADDLIGTRVGEVDGTGVLDPSGVQIHERALAGENVDFQSVLGGQSLEGAVGPVRGDDGRVVGLAGVAINVTARDEAAAQAQINRHRMQDILDRAPASISIRDLDDRLQFVNKNWEEVYGYSREQALGTRFEFVFGARAEEYRLRFRQALASGEPSTNVEMARIRGEDRYYLTVRFPLRGSDGSIHALCAIATDTTESARLQVELHRRQALLDDAQTMARVASWETNLKTGERYWSPHLHALMGRAPGDGPGIQATEDFLAHVVEEDRERVALQAMAAVAQKVPYNLRFRVRCADDSVAWMRVEGKVQCDDDGTANRFYGFVQDITEQVHAADELQKLNERLEERVRERSAQLEVAVQELSSFGHTISHDLREPLRELTSFMARLQHSNGALNAPARDHLEKVQDAAARMDTLIDDLLALSQVTKASVDRVELDLNAIARELAAEITATEPERIVRWQIAEQLTTRADRGLVRIVMQNLLANAFKFSRLREEACIEVGSEVIDGETAIYVRDNGAGFDQSQAKRLFEPFQRLHDQASFEGTGIGLATVWRIVRRHGGWIRADSQPDNGATFRFTFGDTGVRS